MNLRQVRRHLVDALVLVKLIFKGCISFRSPELSEVVIFESTNCDYILPLCKPYTISVIEFPPSEVIINFSIARSFFKNIFNGAPALASYYKACFEKISPRIVITFIDNSNRFYDLARIDKENRRYLAIQNAARYDIVEMTAEDGKQICLPEFACFGNFEVDLYTSKGATINKFYPIGSLREALYRRFRVQQNRVNIAEEEKIYDICVVAEASIGWDKKYPGHEDAVGKIAKYAKRLAEEESLKLVIAGKRDVTPNVTRAKNHSSNSEVEWYKKYIGDDFQITPRKREAFSTYELVTKSRLSIALVSTALRESLSRGGRVMFCNFSGNSLWNFSLERGKHITFLNQDDYLEFKKQILLILEMEEGEYFQKTQHLSNYIINPQTDKDAVDSLKEIINNNKDTPD